MPLTRAHVPRSQCTSDAFADSFAIQVTAFVALLVASWVILTRAPDARSALANLLLAFTESCWGGICGPFELLCFAQLAALTHKHSAKRPRFGDPKKILRNESLLEQKPRFCRAFADTDSHKVSILHLIGPVFCVRTCLMKRIRMPARFANRILLMNKIRFTIDASETCCRYAWGID